MPFYKSLSCCATSILLAFGAATAVHAADEPTSQPKQSGSTGAYLSDSAITAKVKAALISNKLTGISVTTEMGVVSLSGSVASEQLRQQITQIASGIDGVRGVDYTGLSVAKMGS